MRGLDSILYESIVYLTPTLLCVLGGIFAYKANVLNIALEGMMLAGAFVSVLVAHSHENKLFLAYLAAFAVCIFLGLVFSVLGVTLKGNVIIIGLAINMLVPAVAGFVMKLMSLASIPVKWFSTNSIMISIPVTRRFSLIPERSKMIILFERSTFVLWLNIFKDPLTKISNAAARLFARSLPSSKSP